MDKLILMFLCHVLDDFVLQPICLSNLKQKDWWKKLTQDPKYDKDYLMALTIHGFSWSGWILVPWILGNDYIQDTILLGAFLINGAIHMYVDNGKANKKVINLVQDQIYHIMQILITWITLFILVGGDY